MRQGPKITGFEIHVMEREVRNMGISPAKPVYEPGTVHTTEIFALKVLTDTGVVGEYVSPLGAELAELGKALPLLIGLNALEREHIYNQIKRYLKKAVRTGVGAIDNALWDLAGKYYDAPIHELLGGYRKRIPVYLSTTRGDKKGGLDSPGAYADFAQQAMEQGYLGFKIHPWSSGTTSIAEHVAMIHAVGQRVGGKMDLMLDPANQYETFGDTLKVAKACDEENFFWLEDSLNDGGISTFASRKLREMIKTPLLQGENTHGLEQRMNFLVENATDYVRGDAIHDGITATMKLAHAAEAMGVDIEVHVGGPETRQCIAAIRNTNYYEWGLLHPKIKRGTNPLYKEAYVDITFDNIGKDGCIPVPEGPGLGVVYDWAYIKSKTTAHKTYK